MVELISKTPAQGLLPITHGGITVSENTVKSMVSIAPFHGQREHVSGLLAAHSGLALPPVGQAFGDEGARILWFGPSFVAVDCDVPAGLSDHAAVVDVSDGWCALELSGAALEQVLARVTPVDMRFAQFPKNAVVRSMLGHANVVFHRVSKDCIHIFGFRSMVQTLVHDLETAMVSVAAIGDI